MVFRKASQWAKEWFEKDSQPAPQTIRTWVQDKDVPGKIIGNSTFINETQWIASLDKPTSNASNVTQIKGRITGATLLGNNAHG